MASHPPAPGAFVALTEALLERRLASHPGDATFLGDHRRDDQLPDPSPAAGAARAAELAGQLAALESATPSSAEEQVDAAVLRTALQAELLDLEQVRSAEWDPMEHNPGTALYALTSRDFAPLPDRMTALAARLAAVPAYLASAKDRLQQMSAIHLETASTQLDGTIALIDTVTSDLLAQAPQLHDRVAGVAAAARQAIVEHRDWLDSKRSIATRDPRLGTHLFSAKLNLTLDTAFAPEALLARAKADLERVTDAITEQAGRIAGVASPDASTVREVLDRLAIDAPTDETILPMCRDALADSAEFVRTHDLVTVFDDPVDVVEMPEIDRGVAVAYCRPPGPLETATLPTEFAVSPTPKDWTAEQVVSFYREYNLHMLHNLAVHEAMPGHALQLMHSNRYRGSTRVRAVYWSGSFVEGWAVYTEGLMADRGYRSEKSPDAAAALRMQQLKMQLRMIINAILDVRFHCDGLDEAAAMDLMLGRGFQERGEADGKWRRVQLTSTQLSTYYVGYSEVKDLVTDLRRARPGATDSQLHDELLSYGSPPARHLRSLLLPGG
jgi:uncharacterized protein (DUF885 family)